MIGVGDRATRRTVDQHRIDRHASIGGERDKAFREIDIAGGERSADFPIGNFGAELAVERAIADRDRIVSHGQPIAGGDATANEDECGERKRPRGKVEPAGFDLGEVEHLLDQRQAPRLGHVRQGRDR